MFFGFFLQSSEIIFEGVAIAKTSVKPKAAQFAKKYCAKSAAVGLKGCVKVATENAAFISDLLLYKMAGKHSMAVSVTPSKYWH